MADTGGSNLLATNRVIRSMGSNPPISFRLGEDEREFIDYLVAEVDHIDNRTQAINYIIMTMKDIVDSGGFDLLMDLRMRDDISVVNLSRIEMYKRAVREAINEKCDGE